MFRGSRYCAAAIAGVSLLIGGHAHGQADEIGAGTKLRIEAGSKDDKVNLRADAAAASKSLAELPPGASGAVATGRARMNGPDKWIEVRVGNQVGWVHSRYVRAAIAQVKSAPKEDTGGPTPEPEKEATASGHPLRAREGTSLRVQSVPRGDKLNMREFANAKSAVVDELPSDAVGLIATGRTSGKGSDSWVEVKHGSKRGWVNSKFVLKAGPVDATGEKPESTQTGTVVAKASGGAVAIADCDSDDPDRRLLGCSDVIGRSDLSDSVRAIAYSRRSDSLLLKKEFDRAIEDRMAALELEPKSESAKQRASEAHRMRGNELQEKGDLDGAARDYSEAIRIDQRNVAAIAGRAAIYVRRNEVDSAISDLSAAERLDGTVETYKVLLADLYAKRADGAMHQKNYGAAIEEYGRAIGHSPSNSLLYFRRASALWAREDRDSARSDLSEAIRLDPEFVEARMLRAQSALTLGRYREALADLDEVLNREPKNVNALLGRALAWERDGNSEMALADYQAASRADPPNDFARAGVRRLERAAADEQALRDVPETARKLLTGVQPFGPTRWNHNGSTMKLVAEGSRRKFYYERPRKGIRDTGVRRGTLLFDGVRDGFAYSGTARIFYPRCGTKSYAVSGSVAEDEESITLFGKAPSLDASCNVVGYKDDTLYFELVRPRDTHDAPKTSKRAERADSNQYQCCISYKRRQGITAPQGACRNHIWMQRNNPAQAGVSDWCAL